MRLVSSAASPVVVVASPGQDLPTLPDDVRVVRDAVQGRGPLQGLLAGLIALPVSFELAFATATDAALLQPQVITRLAELIGDHDMAVPYAGGFYHPLAGLYRPTAVRSIVEKLLVQGRLATMALLDELNTRVVTADELSAVDPALATLRNLNTPADYQQALKEAGFAA